MKYTLFLFLVIWGITACQDEKDGAFDFTISKESFRFKAIPGGAVMYYQLPDDENIFALNVRYVDAQGVACLKVGGYGSDSLIIDGFNAAEEAVPVQISFVNERNEESHAIEMKFATQESAAYAFFNKAEVYPYWEGFQVIYEAPEQVSGMAHVFYLGTNPLTQEPDTVLLKSFPITEGRDTLICELEQKRDVNTVIIRTEDFRGYRVRQKIWENVEAYQVEKMELTENDFIDVENLSLEYNEDKSGIKYLFDGDTKGYQRLQTRQNASVYTFVAGPGAVGAPFLIDLQQERLPASLRIYGMLKIKGLAYTDFDDNTGLPESPLAIVWQGSVVSKMPCAVSVYGGNDKDGDITKWTKLGSFYQEPTTPLNNRWCAKGSSYGFAIDLVEDLDAATPDYIEIQFPATSETYRYLKLVIDDTFDIINLALEAPNPAGYITMHELEVYVKKD